MAVALLMAGGGGARMRASFGPLPKPLVAVRGVPLLERNLLHLLGAGFRDVVVTVSAALPAVGEWVATRGRALATALGATMCTIAEPEPRGSVGSAADLAERGTDVLLTFADNLSAIDLAALLREHERTGAAVSVAAHEEVARLPYGELRVCDGWLTAYREKPERPVLVSSGTYVLGPDALGMISRGERTDVWQLVQRLLGCDAPVRAFRHDAPWVDVNDSSARARAEDLVAAHEEVLECWFAAPDVTLARVCVRGARGVLLEQHPENARWSSGLWDLPAVQISDGEDPRTGLTRLPVPADRATDAARLALFDDVDTRSGLVVRNHVFGVDAGDEQSLSATGRLRWIVAERHAASQLGPALRRVSRAAAST